VKARTRTSIAIALILLLVGCSKEKPKVRVMNQRSDIVDVQLKRQSGNTYNINDVAGNSATGYIEVDVANFEVEAKPENVSGKATTFFTAEEDKSYTIVIPSTITPTVRVEQP
jgi:hypothetical protein